MTDANGYSEHLTKNIPKIVGMWERRVRQEVDSAKSQERAVLQNQIPVFLSCIAERLDERATPGNQLDNLAKDKSHRVAESHGSQCASIHSYSLDEAILEYHFLRQILFQILEEVRPLTIEERELIVSCFEVAVQDMASQFVRSTLEARDLFVLTLVHDLRGPLSNTTAAVSLLEATSDPGVIKTAKGIIKRSLIRLDRMTTDLLGARKVKDGALG